MSTTLRQIEQANRTLRRRWNRPHQGFGSGTDPRTSDAGLLQSLYGNMERASHFQWLNGGRTLIDKTYLAMLWAALELDAPWIGNDKVAANLDNFIREHLAPIWSELDDLEHEARHELSVELVELACDALFGSQKNYVFASQLLLFLCPQLPIFAVTESQLTEQFDYREYHQQCRNQMALNLPLLASQPLPKQQPETPHLSLLLSQTDWWVRRLQTQLQTLNSTSEESRPEQQRSA
ncbi:hypothetical protein DV711_00060 [Motiliproteus coralliicola]|uniref:Uncharacterized protein n=1 Tax=Motiliproteus coralliicola TaxID=2283196 RepID=A0A369WSI2_9GAMM|nr:hypothetical protein [Motiliproteus coralliicola]RDE24039.1 hypothetical protein DV711_00060 [Motiliproteus coralliicola]